MNVDETHAKEEALLYWQEAPGVSNAWGIC